MSFEERCNESDFFDMEIGLRVHIRACYAEIDRLTYELKVTEGIAGARELDLAELKAKPSLPEQGVKEAVEALEQLLSNQNNWIEKWNIDGCENYRYTPLAEECLQAARFKAKQALAALRTQPVPTPASEVKL